MSSKHHDNTTPSIHLGNYEEFFILYMDGELDAAGMAAVEAFLAVHPDLSAELELLKGTQLDAEPLLMDKSMLFAESMKVHTVSEELLLYLDGELEHEAASKLEADMAADSEMQEQYRRLQATQLSPSDQYSFGDKASLYRKEEKRFTVPFWMRAAAVVLLMAGAGALYFSQTEGDIEKPMASIKPNAPLKNNPQGPSIPLEDAQPIKPESETPVAEEQVANLREERKGTTLARNIAIQVAQASPQVADTSSLPANNAVAAVPQLQGRSEEAVAITPGKSRIIGTPAKEFLNKLTVTSIQPQPYNTTETTTAVASTTESGEGSNRGTVKGFLRRATRLIEKRTGVDPTNDGELLIGVVSVKLK